MSDKPLISFVVPYYKKLKYWKAAMAKQFCLMDPAYEIVLVLDDPSEEEEVLAAIRNKFTQFKFRVLVNDKEHLWCTPSKCLNVGVRHAQANFVAVMSPESILMLPTPEYLGHKIELLKAMPCYHVGSFFNVPLDWIPKLDNFGKEYWSLYSYATCSLYYGFLLAKKSSIEAIGGYDESRSIGGGEDDDLHARLCKSGLTKHIDASMRSAHIIHPKYKERYGKDTHMLNKEAVLKQPEWGRDFDRIAYDWMTEKR